MLDNDNKVKWFQKHKLLMFFYALPALSIVELEISVRLLHVGSITLLKIFGENDTPILPYSVHSAS